MQKILILKGLPGSGKSTFAKELLVKEPGKWKRINKDDLRTMLDNGKWSKVNELYILKARNVLIREALLQGFSVIVDDTNFNPKHEMVIRAISDELQKNIQIEVKFIDTPIEKCIENDLKRLASVGEKVIRDMYNKYLKPTPEEYPHDEKLDNVIICDIDGTLALMNGRSPFDWGRVQEDKINEAVKRLLFDMYEKYKIILLSGRDSICRKNTIKWLSDNLVPYNALYMRPEGDARKDSIVKRELFDQYIRNKYNVLFVLDDRNQVVELWRSMGLSCFQVADGNF